MNYPLARSARVKPQWHQIESGEWVAKLPGEGRIELYVTALTPAAERRAPTGFDMNVLHYVLAQLLRPNCNATVVELRSLAALLHDLGLTSQFNNRAQLKSALSLWRDLALRWTCWYIPGPPGTVGKGRSKQTCELPPPFRRVDYAGRRVIITLDQRWVRLARQSSFYQRIPLPLPNEASVQNCVLFALTRFDELLAIRDVSRKIGMRSELTRIKAVAAGAEQWFANNGGLLITLLPPPDSNPDQNIPPGKVRFTGELPKVPRAPPTPKRRGGHDEVGVAMARAVLRHRNEWRESNPELVRNFVERMLKWAGRKRRAMSPKQAKFLARLFYGYASEDEKADVNRLKGSNRKEKPFHKGYAKRLAEG
jgi:hypothetical protein